MEQLRQQNAQEKGLNRILRTENTILDLEKRNKIEKDKKRENDIIKDAKSLFRLKKENEAIKYRIIRDIRNIFEQEKEYYHKPVRMGNFWSRDYAERESNGDRNKTLAIKEYLNKIRTYLKDIIYDLKNSDTWKIQLTVAISFISSKDNDEEHLMHLKSDNIEIMIDDKADQVIEELFQSLFSINYPSEKGGRKKIQENNLTIPLNALHAKNEKIYPTYFQSITQIMKKKSFFL